ncbi:CDP-glucose 4,6-dehydratase [Polynucleobacter necessarius]|uniref:CDP-glucose 4,6-dehydratase n=1 Tax=Polynucleobacter necessarius TaxID=576610 RepID=UPI000E095481|nr:CDP-glucose 4,6-dehydratase [Polynucleobacter necessarius]
MPNTQYLNKSFKNKKVLITGHTGFKGSWLAFLLSEMGADVMGFALPPATTVNHFNLLDLDKKIKHVVGDIRDASMLAATMKEFQPEFVFHLAAQALVRPSYDDPGATFSTNVMGSVNLLDAVRCCDSVRSLVYITSDKCYENVEWIWGYRENDLLGGRDPYSASKAASEIIFSSYARSFFAQRPSLGAATTRAGNVIGGGDWATDRIIPDCIRAIEAGAPIRLRNPGATRPWQHVLEPLAGYLLLSARLYEEPKRWGGSWNFGPSTNEVRTVQNVAEVIIGHLGKGRIEVVESPAQVHEARLLQLNCDKAHQLLDWYPRWNAEMTLESTALWYKTVMNGGNAEQITRAQIHDFFPELT